MDSDADEDAFEGFFGAGVEHFGTDGGGVGVPGDEDDFGGGAAVVGLGGGRGGGGGVGGNVSVVFSYSIQ